MGNLKFYLFWMGFGVRGNFVVGLGFSVDYFVICILWFSRLNYVENYLWNIEVIYRVFGLVF